MAGLGKEGRGGKKSGQCHLSGVMRKSVLGSDQVRHKPAVQLQKLARGLKFWIMEVEEYFL